MNWITDRIVYDRVCLEHNLKLDKSGHCPECRDSRGQPFTLDMQSYYLVPIKESVHEPS
jgi:hypothetical protein